MLEQLRPGHNAKQSELPTSSVSNSKSSNEPLTNGPSSLAPVPATSNGPVEADSTG